MGMFDNYPQHHEPDNEHFHLLCKCYNKIVVGANSENYFEVLFPYSEDIDEIVVIYNQVERLTYEKLVSEHYDYPQHFIVKVDFTPEETVMFGNTNLDTFAQVRVKLDNNHIIYTDKFKINVIETLGEH